MIHTIPAGPFVTNSYLVVNEVTREAVIIDAAPSATQTLVALIEKEKLTPKAILLTHSHWDHIADLIPLKERFQIPIYVHPLDAPNVRSPGVDGLTQAIGWPGIEPDILVQEGDTITIASFHFHVIHTPGHSPGCVCYFAPKEGVLFSGDTLFKGTIGNLSLPTGDPDAMWPSLKKLTKLPKETKVYPGHGPATTIEAEKWLPEAKKHFGDL